MKRFQALIFISILLGIFAPNTFAQQTKDSSVVKLTLVDGSILIGKVLSESDSVVSFTTSSGLHNNIPRNVISSRETIHEAYYGAELKGEDPNTSRLFFAPTGKALNGRSGYFSVAEIFFPTLAIGIGQNAVIAGGMSLFPGNSTQMFYIMPKYQFYNSNSLNLSAGFLYLSFLEETAGIVYAVGTTGTQKFDFTGGIGAGFSNGEFGKAPFVMLGFEARVSPAAKIISENWIVPGSDGIVMSVGIRFFGTHIAADFGLITLTGQSNDGLGFVPWLGFAYNF